jgi:hypothetical protein
MDQGWAVHSCVHVSCWCDRARTRLESSRIWERIHLVAKDIIQSGVTYAKNKICHMLLYFSFKLYIHIHAYILYPHDL